MRQRQGQFSSSNALGAGFSNYQRYWGLEAGGTYPLYPCHFVADGWQVNSPAFSSSGMSHQNHNHPTRPALLSWPGKVQKVRTPDYCSWWGWERAHLLSLPQDQLSSPNCLRWQGLRGTPPPHSPHDRGVAGPALPPLLPWGQLTHTPALYSAVQSRCRASFPESCCWWEIGTVFKNAAGSEKQDQLCTPPGHPRGSQQLLETEISPCSLVVIWATHGHHPVLKSDRRRHSSWRQLAMAPGSGAGHWQQAPHLHPWVSSSISLHNVQAVSLLLLTHYHYRLDTRLAAWVTSCFCVVGVYGTSVLCSGRQVYGWHGSRLVSVCLPPPVLHCLDMIWFDFYDS
jgi:hypothetical protein